MTEKKRLIELIEQCSCHYSTPCTGECGECHNVEMYDRNIEHIADHLLANGVIVPPVMLWSRQKVYIPIRGTTVVYETKVYGIGIDEDGDMVINPKEYPEDVISMNCVNVGKTVFLTREEAEKALEGRSTPTC